VLQNSVAGLTAEEHALALSQVESVLWARLVGREVENVQDRKSAKGHHCEDQADIRQLARNGVVRGPKLRLRLRWNPLRAAGHWPDAPHTLIPSGTSATHHVPNQV